jgi:hypothetical protein
VEDSVKNISQDTSLESLPQQTLIDTPPKTNNTAIKSLNNSSHKSIQTEVDQIEKPIVKGVVYVMSEGKSQTFCFGQQLRGTKSEDQNIVGLATIGQKDVIYKSPRLPGWNPFWEYSVCEQLQQTLPHLTQFSKAISVTKMPLKCDKKNLCLPQHPRSSDPWRVCNVLIQEYIPGVTLGDFIRYNNSYRKLFSSMFQVLKVIEAAQFWVGYTHYDLHANNVKLKQTKSKNKYYLYDLLDGKSDPLAVFVYDGLKAVLYDNEFGHTVTMDGHTLDSSLVHLCRSYDPTSSDKSIDALRFVTSVLTFYMECRTDEYIKGIRDRVVNSVNQYECGKLTDMGVFEPTQDAIRNSVLEALKDCPEGEIKYANKWLYLIISLLTHQITLPLEKKVETADTTHLISLIKNLYQIDCKYSEHRFRIMHEIVCRKGPHEVKTVMESLGASVGKNPEDFDTWFNLITDSTFKAIPHIETALYFASKENRHRRELQHESDHTPGNLIKLLLGFYQKIEPLTEETKIKWITKSRKTTVLAKDLPKEVLDDVNSATDLADFSKRLKQALLNFNH